MRAFLCHSSRDKPLVEKVANALGRANVAYDAFSFEDGVDFRDSIRAQLDKSDVFIFFVSRDSLSSSWCKFELSNAELRKMRGGITAQIAVILDEAIHYEELPTWLGGTRAVVTRNVNRIVRAIKASDADASRGGPFIGRARVMQQISEGLQPLDQSNPSVVALVGLAGVGRRSVLDRVCRDFLSVPFGPVFQFGPTDSLLDLYLWLVEETAPVESLAELEEEAEMFAELGSEKQTAEIAARLCALANSRSLPCIIDEGGLLIENAGLPEPLMQAIQIAAGTAPNPYIALVLQRKPYIPRANDDLFLVERIPVLSRDDTRILLHTLMSRAGLDSADDDDIYELADFLDGYPPAAAFAVRHIKEYGVSTTLADKAFLEDFKAQRFERFVRSLDLSENQLLILRYLAGEGSLPFDAIQAALGIAAESLARSVKALIDLSVLTMTGNHYGVVQPLRSVVTRVHGNLGTSEYLRISQRLTERYWSDPGELPELAILDASLRAGAYAGLSGDADPFESVALARVSTMHQIADSAYNARDYAKALEYALRASRLVPGRGRIVELLYKCYVRLDRWSDANQVLEDVRLSENPRYHYLRGFGARLQDRPRDAISAFRDALRVGDSSYSVHRELSLCLHYVGDFDGALKEVEITLQRRPNDLYQLDRLTLVLLAQRDFPAAERALRRLESADYEERFIHHRRATFWLKRRDFDRAKASATLAVAGAHGRLEAYAQQINILIEAGDIDDAADALNALKKRFPNQAHDVQVGLRCKSLIRLGFWDDGLRVWEGLRAKDRPVHQSLRKALLLLKAEDTQLTLAERDRARRQAEQISANLDVLEDLSTLMAGREFE